MACSKARRLPASVMEEMAASYTSQRLKGRLPASGKDEAVGFLQRKSHWHHLHFTVLEARAGFYEKPIATLDFASLYPSIMMAYNLCYSTLVTSEDARKLNLPPECVNKTPSGEIFVKSSLQKGILPEILEELLTARRRAKADLKEAKDPLEKAVLDGRQLALKASMPLVFMIFCRQMIEHTKKLVEDKFTILGGCEHNAEVIYGDTDSVMVQFGVPSIGEAMKLGREAAEYISGTFMKVNIFLFTLV
ncbi:hypothetical protein JRO89_XS08G0085600 [Xanthoceras sorbifolium]|uniref:DNA-directed DNA polymerase n=1 Tax=Xanthoceras sorbifolium TaxID=99658 RepID=A0ABQ8HP47_9ROSI|nr:hypothetical protein JRO89_XS08G0085600 [Xanthoceras sorbifolium]